VRRAFFFFGAVVTFTLCGGACGARSNLDAASGASTVAEGASSAGTGAAGNDGGPLPACNFPLGMVEPSANTLCYAGRSVVSCLLPNGSTTCLTGDPEGGCHDPAEYDCQIECQPNEFGFSCGSTGPLQLEPPAGCRLVSDFSPGIVYSCCPCGS
jgi:hypothetical protein